MKIESARGASDRTGRLVGRVAPDATSSWMASRHIELVAARWSTDVETAMALAATLLLRLDQYAPILHFQTPSSRAAPLPRLRHTKLFDAIAEEHHGFASIERFTTAKSEEPDLRLVFGGRDNGISVNSSGWKVSLGRFEEGSTNGNQIAAAFAGVLASVDALQALLEPYSARCRRFRGTVSLWDLRLDGANGPPIEGPVDLNNMAFVACGGVASAAIWALSLLDLTGTPLLVDPDAIDAEGTNLNRHLTAGYDDLGLAKVDLARSLLAGAGATPDARRERWRTPRTPFKAVVTSPDSDSVRREVQLTMPEMALNAGTSDDGMYAVSRHDFLNKACLSCIARADLTDTSPVAAAARRLGLREDVLEPNLSSSEPLSPMVLESASGLTEQERAALASIPGNQVLEHVCGTLRPRRDDPALSAPMLSAAPGVLLANDVVRLRTGAVTPPSMTMTSILTGPHPSWTFVRDKRRGCECTDNIYRMHFSKKWDVRDGGQGLQT